MPYCPECLDEFQKWVKVCPDCGVALVEKLPEEEPEPETSDEPLVHVATAPNPIIAAMWKGILENEGISSLVGTGDLRAAQYVLSINSDSKIYVLASHEKEAKEILAPFIEKTLTD
jgi:hypothetical protein